MEPDGTFTDMSPPKYRGLRDYHLRSALTTGALTPGSVPQWDKGLHDEVKALSESYALGFTDPTSILGKILSSEKSFSLDSDGIQCALKILNIESNTLGPLSPTFLSQASEFLSTGGLSSRYFHLSRFYQRLLIISNAKNAKKPIPGTVVRTDYDLNYGTTSLREPILGWYVYVLSECFAVSFSSGGELNVYHIDHLKNWSDKLTERFNIELAVSIGHLLDSVTYPSLSTLYNFWHIWDVALVQLGNDFYSMNKIFEAICIGVLLDANKNTNISESFNFLAVTVDDFLTGKAQERLKYDVHLLRMVTFLQELPSPHWVSQFYGLYRTWGHPIVTSQEGIIKAKKIGTAPKTISKILSNQLGRVFKQIFCEWYRRTKGIFPELTIQESVLTEAPGFCEIFTSNMSHSTLIPYWNSIYWDKLSFNKTIEIPKTFNLSEMVADKAISPDRSALQRMIVKGGRQYDANVKRGVLQWLLRESEGCEAFLHRVNDHGLDTDELAIGLYPKERELNTTPRMFALMTYSMRNYVVTTEQMLSSDILPAFPQITMTDSLLDLQKKIYSATHLGTGAVRRDKIRSTVSIIVNIDFEKWNLNFRRETTYEVFECLGDLYGLHNLYNRTYDIFEQSLIYRADPQYHLTLNHTGQEILVDGTNCYIGHMGGFEGLRQKGWTVVTTCCLELVCRRHKCGYKIMGQGDNQVLILTFSTYKTEADGRVNDLGKEEMTQAFYNVMADLQSTFNELGLPIKALETWTSEHLFLYGKFPTLRGAPLVMSLKKVCRAYYLANEEIMTLDCALATVAGNALSAAMADLTPWISYVVYKIQACLALEAYTEYHVLLGKPAFDRQSSESWRFTTSAGTRTQYQVGYHGDKLEFWMFLCWFPKILGGLNVAGVLEFLMRGFSDPVCTALTWVSLLLTQAIPSAVRDGLQAIYNGHINPEKSYVLLIEDPCALNLVVPVDARSSIKQAVSDLFAHLHGVQNREFASLFTFTLSWKKDEFCSKLCERDVLHPRLLHDIYAATIGGYVDSIVSKVSKTSTINKIALRSSHRDTARRIENDERNYLAYLKWKINSLPFSEAGCYRCPTQQARKLRRVGWGKILEGVTVPHPAAFLGYSRCLQIGKSAYRCDQNYISAYLTEKFAHIDTLDLHELGGCPPYLGSMTKERIGTDPSRQVFGKEPLVQRPLSLLRVINWFVPFHSHTSALIMRLLTAVSNLDASSYVSKELGITGSEAHRYRDMALKHGVLPTTLYTLGTHIHISTDAWTKYTRGGDNYTINYQAILCMVQALVCSKIYSNTRDGYISPRVFHFHETCPECIDKLSNEFHDLLNDSILQAVPSDPTNSYLWIDESTLVQKYKADLVGQLRLEEVNPEEYGRWPNKRLVLNWFIANSILDDLIGGTDDSHISTGLYDVQEYPRTFYQKLNVKELWDTLALLIRLWIGVKNSGLVDGRVTFYGQTAELAADEIMKAGAVRFLGASLFYTWPDTFSEIEMEYPGALYPDQIPPSAQGMCSTTQKNIREIAKSVALTLPSVLIISRADRSPIEKIKRYYYGRVNLVNGACGSCIRKISKLQSNCTRLEMIALTCEFGHQPMRYLEQNVKVLSASTHRLAKDSVRKTVLLDWTPPRRRIPKLLGISWAVQKTIPMGDNISRSIPLDQTPKIQTVRCITLPTVSLYRVTETLSALSQLGLSLADGVWILGDGLGTSSHIISTYYPTSKIIACAYLDSDTAMPQTFEHVLVSQNPLPSPNINYSLSHVLYNDIFAREFPLLWNPVIDVNKVWCEIEQKEASYLDILFILIRMRNWELIVMRAQLPQNEVSRLLKICSDEGYSLDIGCLSSFNIVERECLLILRFQSTSETTLSPQHEAWESSIHQALSSAYSIGDSLEYHEQLVKLEPPNLLAQQLRRLDCWFASVGITHLLGCQHLVTPIWWDLQTGKLPKHVWDMGIKKVYYLYHSDLIALQARLLALALSMLDSATTLSNEVVFINNWELKVEKLKEGRARSMQFVLKRSMTPVDLGGQHSKILQFIPILRRLNARYGRFYKFIGDSISFMPVNKSNSVNFYISKLSYSKAHSYYVHMT